MKRFARRHGETRTGLDRPGERVWVKTGSPSSATACVWVAGGSRSEAENHLARTTNYIEISS